MNTICQTCHKPLSPERLEALRVLEVPEREQTCISCAPNNKIKGFFPFTSGTSSLIFANRVDEVQHFVQPKEHDNFSVHESQQDIEEWINH
jgi:hypothetical protein